MMIPLDADACDLRDNAALDGSYRQCGNAVTEAPEDCGDGFTNAVAGSASAINSVAGLPGPARVINQGKTAYYCASDPGTTYVPGVGGCP